MRHWLAGMEGAQPVPDEADLERARETCAEHIQVVGTFERFDEFLVVMSREFGWPDRGEAPSGGGTADPRRITGWSSEERAFQIALQATPGSERGS